MAVIARRIRALSDRQTTTLVIGLLLGFFAGAVTVSLVAYGQGEQINLWQWVDGFAQNFGTEMFGAFLTFLLFDMLVGGRQRVREAEEKYKEDQLHSIARLKQADTLEERQVVLDEMRLRDLLKGAYLIGANLSDANLSEADLSEAYLGFSDLYEANLSEADLSGASLYEANLSRASLHKASLSKANLRKANLSGVNLKGADLSQAILEGADLSGSDLSGVDLSRAYLMWANLSKVNLRNARLEYAKRVTCEQLQKAKNLEGVILPDSTKLPGRTDNDVWRNEPVPSWRETLEDWCKTVPADEDGFIIVDD